MSVTIRPMTIDDLPDLYRLLSNEAVMQYLEPPFSMEQTIEFLHHAGLSAPPLVYAVEDDRHSWIAQQITRLLERAAFAEGKDAVLECAPEQEITRHIACKLGFLQEGSQGGCLIYRKAWEGNAE